MGKQSIFASLALLATTIIGAQNGGNRAPAGWSGTAGETFGFVESFVRATYPELPSGPSVAYAASTYGVWDKSWAFRSIEVRVNPRDAGPKQTSDIHQTLLIVTFEFDQNGMAGMRATGQHVSVEQTDAVSRVFGSSGPWSRDRIREHLRGLGARYAADERSVAARLPLKSWGRLLGQIQISDGEMLPSDPLLHGLNPSAGLWRFTMQAERPGRTKYEICVESFTGRVVRVERID